MDNNSASSELGGLPELTEAEKVIINESKDFWNRQETLSKTFFLFFCLIFYSFLEVSNVEQYNNAEEKARRELQEEKEAEHRDLILKHLHGATEMGCVPQIPNGKRIRMKTKILNLDGESVKKRKTVKKKKTAKKRKARRQRKMAFKTTRNNVANVEASSSEPLRNTIVGDEEQGNGIEDNEVVVRYLARYQPPESKLATSYFNLRLPESLRGPKNDNVLLLTELSTYYEQEMLFWSRFNLKRYCGWCGSPFVLRDEPCKICNRGLPRFDADSGIVVRSVRYTGKLFTFVLMRLYELEYDDFKVASTQEYKDLYAKFNPYMDYEQRFVEHFYALTGVLPPVTLPHPYISKEEPIDAKVMNAFHLIALFVVGIDYLDYKDKDGVRYVTKLQSLEWVSYRDVFPDEFSIAALKKYIDESKIVEKCEPLHWAKYNLGTGECPNLGQPKRLFDQSVYDALWSHPHTQYPRGMITEPAEEEDEEQSSDDDGAGNNTA